MRVAHAFGVCTVCGARLGMFRISLCRLVHGLVFICRRYTMFPRRCQFVVASLRPGTCLWAGMFQRHRHNEKFVAVLDLRAVAGPCRVWLGQGVASV